MILRRVLMALLLAAFAGCSAGEATDSNAGGNAAPAGSGGAPAGGAAGTGASSGTGGGVAQGGGTAGIAGTGTAGIAGTGTAGIAGTSTAADSGPPDAMTLIGAAGPSSLSAVAANGVVGLDWSLVANATGYRVYWSASPDVSPATGTAIDVSEPAYVHRGLTNGTTYTYVVTAITAAGETEGSSQASATPGGEWVLEQLGTGWIQDVSTGQLVQVPIERRQHLLLFPEGYLADEIASAFHNDATHATRSNDVDRWIDLVFGIEPYSTFRQAFVVWYLPRASATHIDGADTAFRVSTASGSVTGVGTETASRTWAAIAQHPYKPTDFSGGGMGTAKTATAAFLILDPARGSAGLSGLTTTLSNPTSASQRIGAAFGMGHAHEFTHAFSNLRDEYIETTNTVSSRASATSNVAPSNTCGTLPWAHLLGGTAINPSTGDLVGAFGTAAQGYHSELLCLMNGTHDNGTVYARGDSGACQAASCTLRVEDRMCNFCREMTAFQVFERTGLVTTIDEWAASYRPGFYEQLGFKVPDVVPQSNDVRNPSRGTPIYEACVSAATIAAPAQPLSLQRREGCVVNAAQTP
jgi:Fibronectin type III domain